MNTRQFAQYEKLEIGDRLFVYKALKTSTPRHRISLEDIMYSLPLGLINLPRENY